jgi:putative tryptophan/tyrosine transport system substrate-binding protein
MRRREFIAGVGGAAAWPLAARAQQARTPVVAYVSARSAATDGSMLTVFRKGLNDTGYVAGRNLAIEYRFADNHYDRLPVLMEDLVRRKVDVIVTAGGVVTANAAKAATAIIPIVFSVGGDPIRLGLISSLNRPGGNITGVNTFQGTMGPKQLELVRDLVPTASAIAILVPPGNELLSIRASVATAEASARAVHHRLIVLNASSETDIDAAFASLVEQRAEALIVAAAPLFLTQADQLIALSARHRVPTLYYRREFAEQAAS